MAWRLFGAKPLHVPMPLLLPIGLLGTNFQWNSNRKYIIFIQENACENVCQIGGHFVQWVPCITRVYTYNNSEIYCSGNKEIYLLKKESTINLLTLKSHKLLWFTLKEDNIWPDLLDVISQLRLNPRGRWFNDAQPCLRLKGRRRTETSLYLMEKGTINTHVIGPIQVNMLLLKYITDSIYICICSSCVIRTVD